MKISKILLIVDPQNDFINGVLGTPEAPQVVPNIINKINNIAIADETYIFFTQDTHNADEYLDTQEGKDLPILHCIENTVGWQIEEQIKQAWLAKAKEVLIEIEKEEKCGIDITNENEIMDISIFSKSTFGAADIVRVYEEEFNLVDVIELIGFDTDICVISNALMFKTFFPELTVIVDASCCAGTTPEKHEAALEVMKSCFIKVINE